MWQPETDRRSETARTGALVVQGGAGAVQAPPHGRPLAGFLAQLIVSVDPSLRPSRGDRTRKAAARYAETARMRL